MSYNYVHMLNAFIWSENIQFYVNQVFLIELRFNVFQMYMKRRIFFSVQYYKVFFVCNSRMDALTEIIVQMNIYRRVIINDVHFKGVEQFQNHEIRRKA